MDGAAGTNGTNGTNGMDGMDGADGEDGAVVYTGVSPVVIDGMTNTIGLAPGTADGELLSYNGANWIVRTPGQAISDHTVTAHTNMQPFQTVNYIIALVGIFPSRNQSEPFIGEIIMFGGNFAPRGWALCDGQLLPIAQNTALFSILGTIYGGDGRTTFGLPDLRGRAAIHAGNGPGLSSRSLGQRGGEENRAVVTLTH